MAGWVLLDATRDAVAATLRDTKGTLKISRRWCYRPEKRGRERYLRSIRGVPWPATYLAVRSCSKRAASCSQHAAWYQPKRQVLCEIVRQSRCGSSTAGTAIRGVGFKRLGMPLEMVRASWTALGYVAETASEHYLQKSSLLGSA